MSMVPEIVECAQRLVHPTKHVEHRFFWDRNRNKKSLPPHETIQSGLLVQLYDRAVAPFSSASPDGGFPSTNKPRSRPPLAMEAYSAYAEICRSAVSMASSVGQARPNNPIYNVWILSVVAPDMDPPSQAYLCEEMRRWCTWAAVLTGWETKVYVPEKNCPNCSAFRSLRFSAEVGEGYCNACNANWTGMQDIIRLGKVFTGKDFVLSGSAA